MLKISLFITYQLNCNAMRPRLAKEKLLINIRKKSNRHHLHSGCISLQLPDGKQVLLFGPTRWYCGSQVNDTDSPVQYREPRLCPLDTEPGSPQLTKTKKGEKKKLHR